MTTINELIIKYQNVVDDYQDWFKPNSKVKQLPCDKYQFEVYQEILKDLKELEEKSKNILHYDTLSEMYDGVKYEIIGVVSNEWICNNTF